ncbi:hypothetical protein EZS27_014876 [termite gut metagenome]|uniref:Methane oxygenase PmoA n=1 Tax=termite gut metagenome TaxID=433724 RepID=A0A5J4RVL5_9ZZZZ
MKHRCLFIVLICCLPNIPAIAANKVTITVQTGQYDRVDCIVSADLTQSGLNTPALELYEKGKKKRKISSQVVTENGKTILYWILDGKTKSGTSRTFIVQVAKKTSPTQLSMTVEDTQKALLLKKEGKNILQYNYAHVESPAGVDKSYGRSGFIHPAYSPEGNILTTIQPKDHRHHYGIWNPWTSIMYDGKMYDLWNLGDKKGTVRAASIEAQYQGAVFSGYNARLAHLIFMPDKEKKIIDERWKIKAWNVSDGFLWDFESHLSPSTSLPVLLKEYRYAGFGYRATEEWTKENSEMVSSEGKTRQQIDGTTGRWIYVTGATKTGRSGLLFLGHPDNYNHPEPFRIWDENANTGRGDVFINFAPTKDKDWELVPDKHYVLKYRVLSYEGEMTQEQADRLWNDFAYPPTVEIK